ncbi:MAG: HNH endonuclease, partial [Myxococcales bacterium]
MSSGPAPASWTSAIPASATTLCTVPWCSKAANHAHHIEYRSRGGSDELSNLTSLCAVCHLQGVHKGRIRVWGAAPDQLHWEIV